MISGILVLLNIGAVSLLVGGMLEVAIAEIPLFLSLSHENFVHVHGILDNHIDRYMPFTAILAILTAIGELLLSWYSWHSLSLLLGIASLIVVALISQFVNVPLNRKIRVWQPGSPDSLSCMRTRWIRSHYIRTVLGCIGLVTLVFPLAYSTIG